MILGLILNNFRVITSEVLLCLLRDLQLKCSLQYLLSHLKKFASSWYLATTLTMYSEINQSHVLLNMH